MDMTVQAMPTLMMYIHAYRHTYVHTYMRYILMINGHDSASYAEAARKELVAMGGQV